MNQLAVYAQDSDDEASTVVTKNPSKLSVNSAPEIATENSLGVSVYTTAKNKQITINVPYKDMSKPIQGPRDMFAKPMDDIKNTFTGYVEKWAIPDTEFETQRRTFVNYGYAIDPAKEFQQSRGSVDSYIGDKQKAARYQGATVDHDLPDHLRHERTAKRRRLPGGDASNVESFQGPWAGFEGENDIGFEEPVEEDHLEESGTTLDEHVSSETVPKSIKLEESVTMHLEADDKLRKCFIEVPRDAGLDLTAEPGSRPAGIPKTLLHTWSGHTRGVNTVSFFPKSGHLLLSASMDSTVKLWDVYHSRQCIQTYTGHTKAVRDAIFNADGLNFCSIGYDSYLKVWDTETGKCLSKINTEGVPYCASYLDSTIVVGGNTGKMFTFDTKSNSIVRSCQAHSGPVNSVLVLDEGHRFVSVSEDRTVKLWSPIGDTPLQTVEAQSSLTYAALHPTSKNIAVQSSENQILIYTIGEGSIKMHQKKLFSGHTTAGYTCQVGFSPDGRFLMSADSEGALFVWDWKSLRNVRKVRAHQQVTTGCAWSPQEPSKAATCSWDGTIKFWE